MFNRSNQRVRFTPANGDAVRVRCRASLYEARGEFQLIAEHLEPAGAGALQAAFEQLKGRLEAEGLFAQARKRALPTDVARVGVITSPSGAVIHDILQVLERRCPTIEVCVFPVAVQGEGAAQQIGRAIACANRWQDEKKVQLDALIVGRGGGSMEDLWAFNEEIVARAIADSTLPIISAVGHEVDFTIADMAADVRAPTPSAAAEMVSPDRQEWQQHLDSLHSEPRSPDEAPPFGHIDPGQPPRSPTEAPRRPAAGQRPAHRRSGTATDAGTTKPAEAARRQSKVCCQSITGALARQSHNTFRGSQPTGQSAAEGSNATEAATAQSAHCRTGPNAGLAQPIGHLTTGLCHRH